MCDDEWGYTALHLAAEYGHFKCCKVLLQNGACLYIENGTLLVNNTALHLAAKNGHAEVVELLLEYNASMTKPNWDGKTALELAAPFPKCVEKFQDKQLQNAPKKKEQECIII